ncbi:MAG TPA: hypothetical protein VKA23_03970 [Mariprofundaceae bacterium]|nr:hypothetical protein [Mariprofundaceae bacterium]
MSNIQALPGAFPLHSDKDFITESEWVILKLLCRPVMDIDGTDAEELSKASGGQIKVERADELIRIVRISKLPGLGTWIARLMGEVDLNVEQIKTLAPEEIMNRINKRMGYPLCNEATVRALTDLQLQWKGSELS